MSAANDWPVLERLYAAKALAASPAHPKVQPRRQDSVKPEWIDPQPTRTHEGITPTGATQSASSSATRAEATAQAVAARPKSVPKPQQAASAACAESGVKPCGKGGLGLAGCVVVPLAGTFRNPPGAMPLFEPATQALGPPISRARNSEQSHGAARPLDTQPPSRHQPGQPNAPSDLNQTAHPCRSGLEPAHFFSQHPQRAIQLDACINANDRPSSRAL